LQKKQKILLKKSPEIQNLRDPKLDVGILSQNITLSGEFIKNIEIEK